LQCVVCKKAKLYFEFHSACRYAICGDCVDELYQFWKDKVANG
jgi:hypothetical protein